MTRAKPTHEERARALVNAMGDEHPRAYIASIAAAFDEIVSDAWKEHGWLADQEKQFARIAALEAVLERAEALQKALDDRLPARRDESQSAGAVVRARSELRLAISAARAMKEKP